MGKLGISSTEDAAHVRREILRKPTNPSMPLAMPEIAYLHHGLSYIDMTAPKVFLDRAKYRAACKPSFLFRSSPDYPGLRPFAAG